MDLEALKLFNAVAENGSFTRASIRLGMTQPAIGRRVQRLEEELATTLLYRHGRGVSLTDAGRRLQAVTRDIIAQLEATRLELAADAVHPRGMVTVGLPPSLGSSLSVKLARSFAGAFPLARLQIVEAFSGTLLERLESGTVDIGVLYAARRSPTMLVEPLLREDLYLVEKVDIAPTAPAVGTDELGRGSFVLPTPSNGLRRVVDAAASQAGVMIDISFEIDSLAALKQVAESGPERCILPYGAIFREVAAGRLIARPFSAPGLKALLVSATPLHRPITRLARQTRDLLFGEVARAVSDGILVGDVGGAASEPQEHI